jgi:hypothetical protein
MRIWNNGIALTLLASTLLAACGGGGGGGNSAAPPGPVVSTLSFPLQSAQNASNATGLTRSFTVSVTAVSGTTTIGPCTGSGSITSAPATTPATFEGQAALSSVSTLTITTLASPGCNPVNTVQTSTDFFDSNFVPLGDAVAGGDYSLFQTPPLIPTSVKVGDTGTIGTENSFTDSTKTTATGKTVLSYVIEADTATTAIVNVIATFSDAAGNLTSTQQSRARITNIGALTPISVIAQSADATQTRVVLTYN